MRKWLWYAVASNSIGMLCSLTPPAVGQIVPDRTANSSVRTEATNSYRIEGGIQQGQNLFHSFQQFNIHEEERVTIPDQGAANIFLRVAGNTGSAIDGTLAVTGGANGGANLFLLNPNGITFGRNAALNLNGSFIATTANAIQFGNQGNFSATDPQPPGLLTVNPSAFLFNQMPHGAIVDRTALPQGSGSIDKFAGLRVPDGQSLLLLGGSVRLEAGGLNVFGGRIEVGGVVGEAAVGLRHREGWRLAFDPSTQRANVILTDAQIAIAGGELAIEANALRLNQSSLTANPARSTVDPEGRKAGNITVQAQDQIVATESFIKSEAMQENSGQIRLQADRAINLNNTLITAETFGSGNGGQINVSASSLLLDRSSGITAATLASGNGGSVIVRANSIRLNASSSIFSTAARGSSGNAGQIDLQTNQLSLTQNSSVMTKVFSTSGTGGDIRINAYRIQLDHGAELSAATAATNGGNITLTNTQLLSLDRQSQISTDAGRESGRGNGGNIAIAAQFILANPFSNNDISANAYSGNGGQVDIHSDQVFGIQYRLKDSDRTSDITVSSRFGNPGTVRINGLEADPSRGLTALPTNPVDPATRIAQTCSSTTIASNHFGDDLDNPSNHPSIRRSDRQSQFVVTGRGGLPPSPGEAIGSTETQVAWASLRTAAEPNRTVERSQQSTPTDPVMTEAQGWIVNRAGQVVLVANAPAIAPAAAFGSDRCP